MRIVANDVSPCLGAGMPMGGSPDLVPGVILGPVAGTNLRRAQMAGPDVRPSAAAGAVRGALKKL
ncbi:MAG: hypothetical protein ACOCYW_08915 [Roseicyclus sp.]